MSCCKIHYNQKLLRLLCNMHKFKSTQPWKCVVHTQKLKINVVIERNIKYLMSLSKEYDILS